MIFYGIHPVLESLKSNHPPRIIYMEPKKKNPGLSRIQKMAISMQISVEIKDTIRGLCGTEKHQGVCAFIDDFSTRDLGAGNVLSDKIVMLDGIQDPHNFGAALRVCEVFGFKDIIFHKGDSCGITAAAIKVSTGAIFHLNLLMSNLNTAIKKLKQFDYQIFVLDSEGNNDFLPNIELPPRFCLVVGAEYKGVRFSIKRQADKIITIPMSGKIQSLNVSCALTAALYGISNIGMRSSIYG